MVLGGLNSPLSPPKKKKRQKIKTNLEHPWFNELFRLMKSFGADVG